MAIEEVAIVGAGIGGLTAAHALRQAGFEVRVFERAESLRCVGAGITMQANAMVALDSLGLAEKVHSAGYPIDEACISTWKGRVISEIDVAAISEVVGRVGVSIHRARLVEVLSAGLDDVIEFGDGAVSAQNTDGRARLVLESGREIDCAAVIGCDGLHSAVRRDLLSEQIGDDRLRYAGYTTWRGIAQMSARDIRFTEMWGPGRRFGLVPIADNEVYWFAVDNAPEGQPPSDELLAKMRGLFDGWGESVTRALDCTNPDEVIRTDSHDRPPIDIWGRGRVSLLGDSVHPMMPNLGQGGGQAVESAVVLGRELGRAAHIEDGLRRYESLRRPRANRFVDQSWRLGRISQWNNGLARWLRDFALRLTPQAITRKMLEELYDFDGWYASVARDDRQLGTAVT